MPDDHARIAQLEAQVAALLAKRRPRPRRRLPRRFLPLALATLLVALLPLSLLAADFAFLDLNSGSPHNDNIAAIKAAGITKGCNPPAYDNYCPNGLVTREEMASFLARTAGLGTNPPVANAKTAQTADTATNATTVGSYAPSGLVRVARNAVPGFPATPITATAESATWTPLVSVTITAPEAGFVLVNGTTTGRAGPATCDGSNGGVACDLDVRLRDTASATVVSPYQVIVLNTQTGGNKVIVLNTQTGGNKVGSLAPTYVFPVTAGAHTFVLEGFSDYPANSVSAFNSTITALFVPFAQDGGTTLAP